MWYAHLTTQSGSSYYLDEYTSSDLRTFTYQRQINTSSSGSAFAGNGVDYDPITDTWIALWREQIYRRKGAGAWTAGTYLPTNNSTNFSGNVQFKNGLWTVTNSGTNSFLTSTDGVSFVTRTVGNNQPNAFSYQNGRLLASPMYGSTGVSLNAQESLNGGRSFTGRGVVSSTYPMSYQILNYPYRNVIATYAGQTVVVPGTANTNTLFLSNNDLQTLTPTTVAGLGVVTSVVARD
jgi:hypothetical protein